MSYIITKTESLPADIARLMLDLAQISFERHAEANALGQNTMDGRAREAQSHAYANAAAYLGQLLDAHAA
jgi:hypothetical protein